MFLLGFYNNIQSQPGLTESHFSFLISKQDTPEIVEVIPSQYKSLKQVLLHPELFSPLAMHSEMPLVFCANTLPFFCKIEHRIEKRGGFPMKFRLGEVQQVERKEGKR